MPTLLRIFWASIRAARMYVRLAYPRRRLVRITLHLDDGMRVPIGVPEKMSHGRRPMPNDLREIEQAILGAATARPQTVRTLAKLAKYQPNSYFRAAVTSLVRKRLLTRTADGYALASAPGK